MKGPAGSSYAGAQGAVGYNPNWNTGYQAWPSQPQSNDGSMYGFMIPYSMPEGKFHVRYAIHLLLQAMLIKLLYKSIHRLVSRTIALNGRSIIDH